MIFVAVLHEGTTFLASSFFFLANRKKNVPVKMIDFWFPMEIDSLKFESPRIKIHAVLE